MVIHINPSRINTTSTGTSRTDTRKAQHSASQDTPYVAPRRMEVNFIPAPESLATLISSAVAALRRGIYWDRGTILNLVV